MISIQRSLLVGMINSMIGLGVGVFMKDFYHCLELVSVGDRLGVNLDGVNYDILEDCARVR